MPLLLGCAGTYCTLLTELSVADLLGVAADKVSRCVATPVLFAVWEWRDRLECRAPQSTPSVFCKKGLLYMGLPSTAVLFILELSKWNIGAPTGVPIFQILKITPALPAVPARSRCSGTCRWSSAQRSGRTPLQYWRCSGGSCTAQCSPDAWGAWAAPCGQPCRSQ